LTAPISRAGGQMMQGSFANAFSFCLGRSDKAQPAVQFVPYPNDSALTEAAEFRAEKLKFCDGKQNVVIVEAGSFSPPTVFHLRLAEEARSALIQKGYHVAGGFLSPTHHAYGKKSLVPMHHRVNMVGLSLQDSSWLQVDSWECAQPGWTRTALVLRDRFLKEIDQLYPGAKPMLACGSDLVESFNAVKENGEPVWLAEHVEAILGKCGVVCMTREGTDLDAVIASSPLLRKYKANIVVFNPSVQNNVSSTLVRQQLQQGSSIKYLVSDGAMEYIEKNELSRYKAWGGTDF